MKKLCAVILLLITFSCEVENPISPAVSETQDLASRVTLTQKFTSLGFRSADMDLQSAVYMNAEKTAMLIPMRHKDHREGVIASFNAEGQLIAVSYFEMETSLSDNEIESSFAAGKFSGNLVIRNEFYQVNLALINSKVSRSKSSSARTIAKEPEGGGGDQPQEPQPECAGMTEQGGPVWCAGARYEQMNWFDQTVCTIDIVPCMAFLVISCTVDNCVVNPTNVS
jgi:hypothetical protein